MCTTGRASWHTPCVQCVDRVVRGTHARLPLSGSLATVEKTMLSKKRPPTFGRAVFDWSSSEKGRRRWTRAITIQTRSYSQCVCVRDEHNRSASSRFLPFPFVLSFSAFLRTSRNGEFPRSRDFFHFFFLRGTEARNERESSRKFFGFFFSFFFFTHPLPTPPLSGARDASRVRCSFGSTIPSRWWNRHGTVCGPIGSALFRFVACFRFAPRRGFFSRDMALWCWWWFVEGWVYRETPRTRRYATMFDAVRLENRGLVPRNLQVVRCVLFLFFFFFLFHS